MPSLACKSAGAAAFAERGFGVVESSAAQRRRCPVAPIPALPQALAAVPVMACNPGFGEQAASLSSLGFD
jgi:hypothetical protein